MEKMKGVFRRLQHYIMCYCFNRHDYDIEEHKYIFMIERRCKYCSAYQVKLYNVLTGWGEWL